MELKFTVYNTLSHQKEVFEPREEGVVRMYNCGPTVYNRQHIGNFRSFLFADLLRRWLEYLGYQVHQVMNITDVGHLTDDERGEGDDKIEAQAARERKSPEEISRGYAELFLQDIAELGVRPPMAYPRATDHVPQMLAIIEALLEKGHAYQVGEDVYFDVQSFPRYGALSGNRVEALEGGARVEVREEKRHHADFALWKSDEKHLMKWKSRFGEHGFPGWHIECTAMAFEHLGEELDIHTGGEDNVFPHHECEIAQSESYSEKTFARYWMHARFLQVDGGKMAKSLGNVYTLDDVRERGYSPRILRYALLRGHYRQPLNFTWEVLAESRAALEGLEELVARLRRLAEGQGADADPDAGLAALADVRQKFESAMNDDLRVPDALAAVFELRSYVTNQKPMGTRAADEALAFMEAFNGVLGVLELGAESLDEEMARLIARRNQAREDKDWGEADRIRDALLERGIVLKDTPDGVIWQQSK